MQNHGLRSSPRKIAVLDLRKSLSPKKATAIPTVRRLGATGPSYQALVPTYGFEFEWHYAEKKQTDGIWKYFLAGILTKGGQDRRDFPAFGSSIMMNGTIESIINSHKVSKKTNRINVMPSLMLPHLAKRLEDKLSRFEAEQSGPQENGQLQRLSALQLGKPNLDTDRQLNGDFELNSENNATIKALLAARIQDRQTSFLATDVDLGLHHFTCPEHILASSFIRLQSLKAMPAELLTALHKRSRISHFCLQHQLHALRYDLLDSVANLFPFARHGDVIIYIVRDPLIHNHFFVVAILKTTDGVAGAVFDSYIMAHGLRLKKDPPCPEFSEDVLGLLQSFLTFNSHVLLPEYSRQEKRSIIENFDLYTPKAYTQPSMSNACWLYSDAIIQEFSS